MTEAVSKQRIEYIDVAKGMGILLVLLGHTGFISGILKQFIYAFHMPLFFVISGFLMAAKNEEERDLKTLFSRKAKGLLLPYFIFSILYILVNLIEMKAGIMTGVSVIRNLVCSCLLYGDSVLWFLPCLFIAEMAAVFIVKKLDRIGQIKATIGSGAIFYLLSYFIGQYIHISEGLTISEVILIVLIVVLRAGMMLVFVMVGYLFADAIKALAELTAIKKWAITLSSLIATLGISFINSSSVDIKNINIGNPVFFIIGAFLGTLSIMTLSMLLEESRIFGFFGRNSLIIMCTHLNLYVMYLAISWAWLVDRIVTRAKSYIFLANIMLAAIVMECIIILVIKGIKYIITGNSHVRKK